MNFREVTKLCKHCDKKLVLNNARDIERKNFCSAACRQRWRYEHGDSHFDSVRSLSYTPENIRKRFLPKGPIKCAHCGETFNPDSSRQQYCKECVPDKAFRARLHRYGIGKREWDKLLEQQNGMCALCDQAPYAVDHCHTTGRIRGLLCNRCNILLDIIQKEGWYERARLYLDS